MVEETRALVPEDPKKAQEVETIIDSLAVCRHEIGGGLSTFLGNLSLSAEDQLNEEDGDLSVLKGRALTISKLMSLGSDNPGKFFFDGTDNLLEYMDFPSKEAKKAKRQLVLARGRRRAGWLFGELGRTVGEMMKNLNLEKLDEVSRKAIKKGAQEITELSPVFEAWISGEPYIQQKKEVDLKGLIKATLAEKMNEQADEVELYLDRLPESVLADPGLMRIVIANIAGRNLKDHGEAPITIKADQTKEDKVLLRITNKVKGNEGKEGKFPFADPETIFERGVTTKKGLVGKSGLGLAISRWAAREMEGELTAEILGRPGDEYFSMTLQLPQPKKES